MSAARTVTAADLAEIHLALAQFGHVFDNGDADELGEVFTEDVTVENTIGLGYSIPGIGQAAAFTRARRPDTPDHQTLDTVVLVGDDGIVRARSRYIATLVDGRVHGGDYYDIVEPTSAGWRISYRVSVPRHPVLAATELPAEFAEQWRPTAENLARISDD
ncbi:nuclear transport factor 2 family protein [Yinghuangia soli]|uniref:Nuclear transport factor 2 family protein n=1 Tax=Yinghuangia soli TaxID=2908204 RepID=A0AA41PWJ2_9ACTN|nr:nuclear transport factor 2 family protein [Yinghuangia soli]MCF2527155.1 nuclear transport factor 2 family protein [Yinghuangia soli]